LVINNDELRPLLQVRYTLGTLAPVRRALDEQRTLDFPRLPNGLFPAATVAPHSERTGYKNAWVRDNVHVAHAHWVNGNAKAAVDNVHALGEFFTRYRRRFVSVIQDPTLARGRGNRPHVRFNGETLTELPEKWPHDQNDALGYFVWLYLKLATAGELTPARWSADTLALFPKYFHAIQYWQDPDSGHWEEPPRKVAASSIGTVLASLKQMKFWSECCPEAARQFQAQVTEEFLDELISRGAEALNAILPWESRGSELTSSRQYDAALLFLIYPLKIVDDRQAEQIVHNVINNLQGEYGIKRYLGDSFYCTNYETNLNDRDLTKDFSDDIADRDAYFVAGAEAQWCLFDPILSIYYGLKFRRTHADEDLVKQTEYLNRSLGQITGSNGRYGGFQCPELYYFENGNLQTSKSTPLLWTQANLWIALKTMGENLQF
jgi:hypothetical protein